MRNMSFILTKHQVYDKTKTHTIREGWANAKPGEVIMAVEQCQGLKKGEKITRIGPIRIVSNTPDVLINVTPEICKKEGFPELTPVEFADMFCKFNRKASRTKPLNFISFEYI